MPWHCLSRSLQGKALSKTAKTLLHYALWGEARGGPHLDFHSVRRFYKAAQLSSSSPNSSSSPSLPSLPSLRLLMFSCLFSRLLPLLLLRLFPSRRPSLPLRPFRLLPPLELFSVGTSDQAREEVSSCQNSRVMVPSSFMPPYMYIDPCWKSRPGPR